MEQTTSKQDLMAMKLVHYFITKEGYHPVMLHGANQEVWLEKVEGEPKIIRIVSNYIHNEEQFEFELYKTEQIMKKIGKKICCFKMDAISFFVNLGDNVEVVDTNNVKCIGLRKEKDLDNYTFLKDFFPEMNINYREKGEALLQKISRELTEEGIKTNREVEEVFTPKVPYVTYALIAINVIYFLLMTFVGNGTTDVATLIQYGANIPELIQAGQWYRLVTSAFIHLGLAHLLFNMYALYVIGSQVESFFGKAKYLIIYLGSAITGNLLSMVFTHGISAGASGAIFGLLGCLLYFGYHYRVYLGNTLRSQIIPLILINLVLGFLGTGIDNAGHIGGLIGGLLLSMAVGIKNQTSKAERTNGIILSIIFVAFLIYMAFFRII